MYRQFCKGFRAPLAVMLGLAGASQTFAATISQISIVSGASSIIVADNGAGDLEPTAGVVLATGPVGSWNVNVGTGLSRPVLGSAGGANMDLNSVTLSTTGASAPVTFQFWDFDFTSSGTIPFISAIGGTVQNADISWSLCIDDGNGQSCATPLNTGSFGGEGAYSSNFQGSTSVTGPFSVGLSATITPNSPTATAIASFDYQVTQVPVPAAAWLFGSALVGLTVVARRKAKA